MRSSQAKEQSSSNRSANAEERGRQQLKERTPKCKSYQNQNTGRAELHNARRLVNVLERKRRQRARKCIV